jgi:hypothetical protein
MALDQKSSASELCAYQNRTRSTNAQVALTRMITLVTDRSGQDHRSGPGTVCHRLSQDCAGICINWRMDVTRLGRSGADAGETDHPGPKDSVTVTAMRLDILVDAVNEFVTERKQCQRSVAHCGHCV